MGWNGSGIFTRVHNWVQDALAGIDILAERMDAEDDNFSDGINNCLAKDGQNAPTQDLPRAGNKHIDVGPAVSRDEYLTVAQYQDGWGIYTGVTEGTADQYTTNFAPVIPGYVVGMRLWFKAHVNCNANATLDVNAVGERPLLVDGAPVLENDIVADRIYAVVYNGTGFDVIGSVRSSAAFLLLEDTPASYETHAGKALVVNDAEDALEYSSIGMAGFMHRTSNQNMPQDVATKVTFTDTGADKGGIVDLANDQFVIPQAGFYSIRGYVQIRLPTGTQAETDYHETRIYRNGVQIPGALQRNGANDHGSTNAFCIVECTAGDIIDLRFFHNVDLTLESNLAGIEIHGV